MRFLWDQMFKKQCDIKAARLHLKKYNNELIILFIFQLNDKT
jgi:hypothetical protein